MQHQVLLGLKGKFKGSLNNLVRSWLKIKSERLGDIAQWSSTCPARMRPFLVPVTRLRAKIEVLLWIWFFLSEEIGSHAYFKLILFFETGSNYVAQARLKAAVILLPQPSKCKDHWREPPGLALQAFVTLKPKQNKTSGHKKYCKGTCPGSVKEQTLCFVASEPIRADSLNKACPR